MTDIKQMAGRIRNGVEHLYIIMDSCGYGNPDGPYASYIQAQLAQGKINSEGKEESPLNIILWDFCKDHNIPDLSAIRAYENEELGMFIDDIKKPYPYIEFDYIYNEFRYNAYRLNSKNFYADEIRQFDEAALFPDTLVDFFLDAFPESVVHEPVSPFKQAFDLGWDFMIEHINENILPDELDELLIRLDELLTSPQNRKRRKSKKISPNRLLHQIGLDYHRESFSF